MNSPKVVVTGSGKSWKVYRTQEDRPDEILYEGPDREEAVKLYDALGGKAAEKAKSKRRSKRG